MSTDMASRITAAQLGSRVPGPLPVRRHPAPVAVAHASNVGITREATSQHVYVRVDGLNLRTEPGDDPSTVILALDIGEPFQVLGDSNVAGWEKVSAEIGDRILTKGILSANTFAHPEASEVESLLRAAFTEWFRFERGKGAESIASLFRLCRRDVAGRRLP